MLADLLLSRARTRPARGFDRPEQLVLHYGHSFVRDLERDPLLSRMAPKKCFMNASLLANARPDRFAYCEGYAMSCISDAPVHHAWVVDKITGHAFDPTWSLDHTPYTYWGIALEHAWALDKKMTGGWYALFRSPIVESFYEAGIPDEALATIGRPKSEEEFV